MKYKYKCLLVMVPFSYSPPPLFIFHFINFLTVFVTSFLISFLPFFTMLCLTHIQLLFTLSPFSFFAISFCYLFWALGRRFSLSLFLSLHRSFLTSTDKENMFTLDHFPVWYRRAAEYPAGQFLYYMPRQDNRGTVEEIPLLSKHTHT